MKELNPNEDGAVEAKAAASLRNSIKWSRYQRILRTRWWVFLLSVGAAMVLFGWHSAVTPPLFVSTGRMMVSGQISLPGNAVYSEEASNFFGTQISLMESQVVRSAAEASLRTKRPDLAPCEVAVKASQQARASLFSLTATGKEPGYTQALLNAVMQEYMNTKKEMCSEKSETTVSAISEQLDGLERHIKTGEDDLIVFQKENNVHFLQTERNSAAVYLSGIDKKLADLNTEYQLLNMLSLDANIDRQQTGSAGSSGVNGEPGAGFVGATYGAQADYLKAKQQLILLKAKREDFSEFLKPKHPIIVQLNDEIALQEKLIVICQQESKSQLTSQRESVRMQIKNLQNERQDWSSKALDLSGRVAQYESLKSKVDRLKALYERLLTSMQAVDVNKNISQSNVAILESASPSRPLKMGIIKTLCMAIVSGLGVGLGILILNERLNDQVVSSDEFCSRFPLQVLGRIPKRNAKKHGLLCNDNPDFSEAFSGVRSALTFLPQEMPEPTSILISSAVPSEGKTTVASNLATVMAMGGARTLLVDADLRRGNLHVIFGLSNEQGFSHIIQGEADWHQAMQSCAIDNLSVIPRGKPPKDQDTSKYLLGRTVKEFLKQASAEFDFVIFDSSPVLATDDTTTLAPQVDAVISVVRLGFSSARNIAAAQEQLSNRRVNVLGVILNMLDSSVDRARYYCYRAYYAQQTK